MKLISPENCLLTVAVMSPDEFYKRCVIFPVAALTNKNSKMLDMINETTNKCLRIVALTATFTGVPPKARTQDGTVKDQVFSSSETEKSDAK